MDLEEFKSSIKVNIPVDTALENPGGGTSKIISYSENGVTYKRRNSAIYVSFEDLFSAYNYFKGLRVTSTDLKDYNHTTFDSHTANAGHSCNCTFLFLVLNRIGVVEEIKGRGVRGDPFFVDIPD